MEHQDAQTKTGHSAGHGKEATTSRDSSGDGKRGSSAGLSTVPRYTKPQLVAVSDASVLALVVAIIIPTSRTNLRLSARDVGGAIMPPGMIMTYDTPGQSMVDMAAVDPRNVAYTAPPDARGDQSFQPRIENGVKIFDLEVSVIRWNILPEEQVMAYAFNHQVPGPRLRITEGDRIRINVTNRLPEETSVHWHGLVLPNAMDGAAEVTQKPIVPGETYTYEFTTQQTGTFFYHTHKEPDRQQSLGMYGALIVDPKTPPSQPAYDLEYTI